MNERLIRLNPLHYGSVKAICCITAMQRVLWKFPSGGPCRSRNHIHTVPEVKLHIQLHSSVSKLASSYKFAQCLKERPCKTLNIKLIHNQSLTFPIKLSITSRSNILFKFLLMCNMQNKLKQRSNLEIIFEIT